MKYIIIKPNFMKKHFNRKFDLKTEEEICRLYQISNEYSSTKLGKKFGCSYSTIISTIKRNGIKIRGIAECQIGLQIGDKSPNFKGGNISPDGYKRFYLNGKLKFEHRHIMEQHLGRKLTSRELVHHIDEDKLNNHIGNLQIVSRSEHINMHRGELVESLRKKRNLN